jgi:hypothetical protein
MNRGEFRAWAALAARARGEVAPAPGAAHQRPASGPGAEPMRPDPYGRALRKARAATAEGRLWGRV